ncbi:MAG: DJ-1/PfpI family protein [Ruminococcaceae bacterium]|nr:DJ-1/PfpI family protein [Oscillospiraceae bacterium]
MVYVFLANGFEETEAICPIDIMIRAGIDVELVSVSEDLIVKGAHGITLRADKKIKEISIAREDLELIMLPGGMPGTTNLFDCRPLRDMLVLAANKGITLAAICAAPMILGRLGLLADKNAVCYPGFEGELIGAKIPKRAKVAVSENIITAAGMGVATEFGLAIVEKLRSKEAAVKIAKAIRFK